MTEQNYRRTNCISYLLKPKEEETAREPTEEELERLTKEQLDAIRRFDGYGMYKGGEDERNN